MNRTHENNRDLIMLPASRELSVHKGLNAEGVGEKCKNTLLKLEHKNRLSRYLHIDEAIH